MHHLPERPFAASTTTIHRIFASTIVLAPGAVIAQRGSRLTGSEACRIPRHVAGFQPLAPVLVLVLIALITSIVAIACTPQSKHHHAELICIYTKLDAARGSASATHRGR